MTVIVWLILVALSVLGLAGLGFQTAAFERSGRPPSWPDRVLAGVLFLQAAIPAVIAALTWIMPWAESATAGLGGAAQFAPLAAFVAWTVAWTAAVSLTGQFMQNLARRVLGLPTKPILRGGAEKPK